MRFASELGWRTKLLMLVATALVAACGEELEGPSYEGESLATFKGQLHSTGQVAPQGGVRMALAWFSHMGASGVGQPAGIITEEVVYQGEFPITYSFNVTRPPPTDALADLSEGGGPKRGAVGVLLAYEDHNGNGRLDTIPVNGQPVDKVLGASMDFYGFKGMTVVYVDQAAGPGGDPVAQQLGLGFNLIHMQPPASGQIEDEPTVEVVPLNTLIPISLTADPALNIYVCDEVWSGQATDEIPCGIVIDWPESPQEDVFVGGVLGIDHTGAFARIDVMVEDANVLDATVSVGGTVLTGDGFGGYETHDPAGALFVPGGSYTVQVAVPGQATVSRTVTLPGDFSILAPLAGASFPVGELFSASWTASSGAVEYGAQFMIQDGPFAFEMVYGTTWDSDMMTTAGPATFTVTARGEMNGALSTLVSRQVEFVCE